MKNKSYYQRYKDWKNELRRKIAQRYADLIIRQLENSTSDWEFNYWHNQGVMLDAKMVGLYDIYLD